MADLAAQVEQDVPGNPFASPASAAPETSYVFPQQDVAGNPFSNNTAPPDTTAIKDFIDTNFAEHKRSVKDQMDLAAKGSTAAMPTTPPLKGEPGYAPPDGAFGPPVELAQPAPKVVEDTFLNAVQIGLKTGAIGHLLQGQKPDMLLPEDVSRFNNIASQLTTAIADLPIAIPAGVVGGIGGTFMGLGAGLVTGNPLLAIGGGLAGGALGTGFAGMAAPAVMRKILVDHYERGDIRSWPEFWDRTAATFIEGMKQGAIGASTFGMGKVAGNVLGPLVAPITKTAGVLASEIATMVTVGKLMEGTVPKSLDDFTDAAAVTILFHGAMTAASKFTVPKVAEQFARGEDSGAAVQEIHDNVVAKLKQIFIKTGTPPLEVAKDTTVDPVLRQQLMAKGDQLPMKYQTPDSELPTAERPVEHPIESLPKGLTEEAGPLSPLPESVPGDLKIAPRSPGEILAEERGSIVGEPKRPEPKTDIEKAWRTLDDSIGQKRNEDLSFWDALKNSGKDLKESAITRGNIFYENIVDKYDPMLRLVKRLANGETLAALQDPYKLMRLAIDTVGKGEHFLKFGILDYETLNSSGEKTSLRSILQKHEAERLELNRYIMSRRFVELSKRVGVNGEPIPYQLPEGFTLKDAAQTIQEGNAKFAKTHEALVDYSNSVLKYLKDSGRISDALFAKILEANKDYIPLYKILESGDLVRGKGDATSNPIKEIKSGSSAQFADPVESIIRNTFEYIRLAENNRATRALFDLADKLEAKRPPIGPFTLGQELVKKVNTPLTKVEVTPEEISKYLESIGVEATPQMFELVKGLDVFRGKRAPLQDGQVAAFVDGKMQIREVSPDVARAWRAMGERQAPMSFVMKVAAFPAKALRTTLGLTPDFIIRNYFRDQITAGAFSKYDGVPFIESLVGLGDIMKDSENYQNWLKSGGTAGHMASIDRNYIENNIWQLSKKTGLLDSVPNVIRHPLDAIKMAAEFASHPIDAIQRTSESIENSTRIGEFKKVAGANPDTKSIFEGGFASREVTVDFQRRGASIQAYNAITAFWNAQVQGLDRAGRAFAEHPVGTTARVVSGITLPSVMLWAANHNDPRYIGLPQWQKDMFWIFLPWWDKNAAPWKIPKPFEVGVLFGSLPERALEGYFGHVDPAHPERGAQSNPDAYKNFMSILVSGFLPNYMPTILTPVIEQFANRSMFTGRYLVPKQLEGLNPELQYTEYSTESSKIIGKFLQKLPLIPDIGFEGNKLASPLIIENYVRAWTGNTGMYILRAADEALIRTGRVPDPQHATTPLAQMPFIKAFMIQSPSPSNQCIQDFYEEYGKHRREIESLAYMENSRDIEGIKKLFADPERRQKLRDLKDWRSALHNMSQTIHMTDLRRAPENATPAQISGLRDDKRRIIDNVYRGMINICWNWKSGHDAERRKPSTPLP